MDPKLHNRLKALAKNYGLSFSGLISFLGTRSIRAPQRAMDFDDTVMTPDILAEKEKAENEDDF